jgi:hypothetical protein
MKCHLVERLAVCVRSGSQTSWSVNRNDKTQFKQFAIVKQSALFQWNHNEHHIGTWDINDVA